MSECNCGGLDKTHNIGDIECNREWHIGGIRKISCESDKFFVRGSTITGFTL